MIRCAHCGLLHVASRTTCPTTGLPIHPAAASERRQRSRPPGRRRTTETGARISSPPRPAKRGEIIGRLLDGRYQVLAAIGQGGMGTVYDADDRETGRRVALKVLKTEHAEKRDAITRLRREAEVVGRLQHDNICAVFDSGALPDGSPYVVMERLHGETLAARLERVGPMRPHELADIFMQVLEGLRAAHTQNVVHRDMKPDNIYLSDSGSRIKAKILDFGISKGMALDDKGHRLTRTGMVMGTPYYMSPEQAMGERDLDGRVDVWGAGVALYEALTGRRPFVAKNYNALLVQILSGVPVAPHEIRPEIPAALGAVVLRALEKRREDRFQRAEEFRAALAAFRRPPKKAEARSLSGLPRVSLFGPSEDSSTASEEEEPTLEMVQLGPPPHQWDSELPTDQDKTEVDPPFFSDSEHAVTERRRK